MKERTPYTAPTVEALRISSTDVITTSPTGNLNPNDAEGGPMTASFGDFF